METDKRKYIFEELPVSRAVWKLAVPTILSQLISLIYNLADTLFVGMTGNPDMVAAVTLSMPAVMIMITVANMFGIGGSSVISRALGAKDIGRAKSASAFCLYAALTLSALISIIALVLETDICLLLGASENTLPYVKDYIFWTVGLGGIPTVMSATMGIVIRSDGNALQAAIGMALGAILNIILDPIFILVFDMGVAGAASATMLSNCASVIYFVVYLIIRRHKTVININPRGLKEGAKLFPSVFSVGAPAALNTLLVSVSVTILNNLTASYGDTAVAALGVVKKIDLVPWSLMFGLTQGILPLIGYNYAAGNHTRMKNILKYTLGVALILNIVCLLVFEIFAPQIVRLFIQNDEVVRLGSVFLRIFCTCVPFMSIGYMFNTSFQALGKGGRSLILSVCRQGIFFIPLLYAMKALGGLYGIVLTQTVSDFIFAAMAVTMFALFYKKLKKSHSESLRRGH